MEIKLSSSIMKAVDLVDQRRKLDKKINDTMQAALYEALQKIHDALEAAGFSTDDISVDVTPDGLMFRMYGVTERKLLRFFSNRGAGPSREIVEEWCRKHYSQVKPRDFIRRNRFYFSVIDWEKLLLEETRCSDIPLEGKRPELTGDFDYTGEWDTFALDGKRYHVEEGQTFIWNGREYTWCCGQPMNDL